MSTTVYGMEVGEILTLKNKAEALGLEIKDLIEYLDRGKVQLFAEMKSENRQLKIIIANAQKELGGADD